MKKNPIVLAEHKCLSLTGGDKLYITLVSLLSQAREYVKKGRTVLLDRYQGKGKSVVIFPAQLSKEDLKSQIEQLEKMTEEVIEMAQAQKLELLKFTPEKCANIHCYEVSNYFAAMMRNIQTLSEDIQA